MTEPTSGTSESTRIVVIDDGFPAWMHLSDKLAAQPCERDSTNYNTVAINPFEVVLDLDAAAKSC